MQESNAAVTDADKLFDILNSDKVHPTVLDSAVKNFSDATKNQVVTRVVTTFEPPVRAALLTRLLFILTEQNRAEMSAAFIANLRSPLPEARKASLQGLEKLKHPALDEFALLSLRDDSDGILSIACQILVPRAQRDPTFWKVLHSAYRARAGKREYYLSNSILEAHGLNHSVPPSK
jgi:hypothetical protein